MFLAMLQQVDSFVKTCKSPRTAEGYKHVLVKLTEWLSLRGGVLRSTHARGV